MPPAFHAALAVPQWRARPPRAACPRAAPRATLSLPHDGHSRPRTAPPSHTEETKRKIGASVRAAAARRRQAAHLFMLSTLAASQDPNAGDSDARDARKAPKGKAGSRGPSPNPQKRRRRRQSAESRRKISAALKGRAKTPEHRDSLRKRFEGDGNPMYGRKLSAEARAKISAAMTGKRRKQREAEGKADEKVDEVEGDVLGDLRDKAEGSRLLSSERPTLGRMKRSETRRRQDCAEEEQVDKILNRVAGLQQPPESVVRTLLNTKRVREEGQLQKEGEKRSAKCHQCSATGFVKCPECVGAFGVASARCELCFGAGAVFCEVCQGVGELTPGGNA